MQHMITEYEKSRTLLTDRIHEITQALRDPALQNKEREQLLLRRDMLVTERTELLHIIREMKTILEVKPIGRTHQYGESRQGQKPASGPVQSSGNQSAASEDHTPGAA